MFITYFYAKMVSDKSEIYLGFISSKYDELKHSLNVESFKRYGCGIDEDIFHDTIIKSCDKMKNAELTVVQVLNYVFVSYFTNYLREFEYARNKYRSNCEIKTDIVSDNNDNIEFDDIIESLRRKFGDSNAKLFVDWCYGASVREITEENGGKNFRYMLDKMRNYIKNELK